MDNGTVRPKIVRRQYLVAKKFQLKYVGLILLFMFLTAAICSWVVYYTSMVLMGEKLANVYPQGRLISIFSIVNFRILLSLLIVSPIVAAIGIYVSHKIAGPVARIERALLQMASGDFSPRLTLRHGDELTKLAENINTMAGSLTTTLQDQKNRIEKISAELDKLKDTCLQCKDPSGANRSIASIDTDIKGLSADLAKFKF